ncbi:MAG: hypothetical protein A2464_09620 [Deltaproteobacteria bacterium RIFOXYC2_FULL_48_10]|nr:MAG: hypothetical protein A2464_09620 [Deltaproteobacteria bacterium RIFOXYC2_FULL_48_10]
MLVILIYFYNGVRINDKTDKGVCPGVIRARRLFYFHPYHFKGEMEQGNQRILKRRSENGNEIFKGK